MYLFFDTETTGLPTKKSPNDPNQAHIMQLGALLTSAEGEILEEFNILVQIGATPINPYALAAHGISAERANTEGVSAKCAFERFHILCDSAECLIAHNYKFDFKLIELTAAQIAAQYDDPTTSGLMMGDIKEIPFYCTMVQSKEFCALPFAGNRKGFKFPKLTELHTILFGEEFSGVHDAMADATATMKCFFELRKRGVM